MVDDVVATGRTVLVTDEAGTCSREHHGCYHRGTRVLDRYQLAVGDRATEPIGTLAPRPGERVLHAEVPGDPPATVRRTRILAGERTAAVPPGVYERVEVHNGGDRTLSAALRLAAGTRFDDHHEVRGIVDGDRTRSIGVVPGDGVAFSYDPDDADVHYRTGVAFDADAQVDVHGGFGRADAVLGTDIRVASGDAATVHVAAVAGDPVRDVASGFAAACDGVRQRAREWQASLDRVDYAPDTTRGDVVRQSLADLLALTVDTEHGPVFVGGLPWVAAPSGRDALLAAYMTLPLTAGPAEGALRYFASRQATGNDAPGAILRERRQGELAVRGEIPHAPNWGSAEATPLFVVLLHETWRATGDDALLGELWASFERAVGWIERAAEGFLRSSTEAWDGVVDRPWRDGDDAVVHPDGRPAAGPLALASVQGYAHDAMVRAAILYRRVRDDGDRALALERQARTLREAFDAAFWLADERFYAVALDGDAEPVRAVTSLPGHCLWSGVVPDERADAVVDRLLAEDCFSGWGVRSFSTGHDAYDPGGAHRGGVWPHDTALAALGAARYGRRDAARRIVGGLFDAAATRDDRLPELFTGHERADSEAVVADEAACELRPWAAAAPLACLWMIDGLAPSLDV